MAKRVATVTIERAGEESPPQTVTAEHVAAAVARLEAQRDMTITIELDDADERLLIAVDGSVAFVGLERADAMFQFVTEGEDVGTHEVVVGGQATSLDRRYLMDVATAAAVAQEWCNQDEQSLYGWWERQ